MESKFGYKQKAIQLRKKGLSYSEIQTIVPVSKASLSLWLGNIPLSLRQKKRLIRLGDKGRIKASIIKRRQRLKSQQDIWREASGEINLLTKRELWLLGIMAYWCEGSKQKVYNISQPIVFSNSDPFLLKLFVKWLKSVFDIKNEDIVYSLYIHEKSNVEVALKYWSKTLEIPKNNFGKTVLKKHNPKTLRKNIGINYYGLIRILVRRSTNLNRKITGWVDGINLNL